MNAITFETIQHSLNTLDRETIGAATAATDHATLVQRVVATYRAVRPLLVAVALLPVAPPQFREGMQLFVSTLDQLTASAPPAASATGDFKAGKDL